MSDLIHSLDGKGWPILLAKEKPAAAPPQEPITPSIRPATVKHDEWARRQDAVRDAAREFEDLTEQDLRERLKGVTTKPLEEGDLSQFRVDVRAKAMDDYVDALDQRQRGILRGRRTVRVVMPKGYMTKFQRTLTQPEADQITARLKARQWDDKAVEGFTSKLKHLEPDPAQT